MDLSAVIFVVLAIAWAGYLIPKAIKHHDELAGSQLDEAHTDKARVLTRHRRPAPKVESVETPAPPLPTRAAARGAARRRRRVLAGLFLGLAITAGLAWFGLAPWWATAIPGGMILMFLVTARLAVRAQQRARSAARVVAPVESPVVEPVAAVDSMEDTTDIPRAQLDAALADDGSLWDPLPMTLPTYVNKTHVRRTVRTIELTGISSSGHDAEDTALVRAAREAQEATEAAETAEAERAALEERRVAGA